MLTYLRAPIVHRALIVVGAVLMDLVVMKKVKIVEAAELVVVMEARVRI